MATNYQRGRAFEYRTRDRLKKDGAVYVMRAAQSKGEVDLLALWSRHERIYDATFGNYTIEHPRRAPWLVQCKRDGRLSARDEIELVALAEATGSIAILAKTGPKGRGIEFVTLPRKESQ